jgi:Asp-tRNA(Asn)/Glu-tRNA(Gln) amidotransferase A subunit family amidase
VTTTDEIAFRPALEVARLIRERSLSPVEVLDAFLARIEQFEPQVNSFITLTVEEAMAAAKNAEMRVMTEPVESLGRLHGVPIAIKDLTPTVGTVTTFGLKERSDHLPEKDGVVWQRLKSESPILLGKTATPPLGCLVVTESELNGRTNNPWDLSRTVGGSSGGSAAAVASGFVALSTGSDGGASIRVPASYCGVVGLKPSLGRIPLLGEASRFETAVALGPITRSVADAALMLSIMAGPHSRDPYALPEKNVDYTSFTRDPDALRGKRLGFLIEGLGPVEPDVVTVIQQAAALCTALGASVEFVSVEVPDFEEYFMDFWASMMSPSLADETGLDFSAYPPLETWQQFGAQAKVGPYLDAAYSRRDQYHEAFATLFDRLDFIMTPTTPQAAFPHPDPALLGPELCAGQRVAMPAVDFARFTDPVTQANYPSVTIPCGFTAEELPVGLQVVGPHRADGAVLSIAAAFEGHAGAALRRPF